MPACRSEPQRVSRPQQHLQIPMLPAHKAANLLRGVLVGSQAAANFTSAVSLLPAACSGPSGRGLSHLHTPLLPIDESQLVGVPALCLGPLGLGYRLQGVQGGGLSLPICSRSLGRWRLLLWGADMLRRLCKLVPAGRACSFRVALGLRCMPCHLCTPWAGSGASGACTHKSPCSTGHPYRGPAQAMHGSSGRHR